MDQWHPINTAPHDGTYILLWAGTWRHPFPGQALASGMALLDIPTVEATTLEVFATHWMPMPDPPIS